MGRTDVGRRGGWGRYHDRSGCGGNWVASGQGYPWAYDKNIERKEMQEETREKPKVSLLFSTYLQFCRGSDPFS